MGLTNRCLSYYLHVLRVRISTSVTYITHIYQFPNSLTKRDVNVEPTGVSGRETHLPYFRTNYEFICYRTIRTVPLSYLNETINAEYIFPHYYNCANQKQQISMPLEYRPECRLFYVFLLFLLTNSRMPRNVIQRIPM